MQVTYKEAIAFINTGRGFLNTKDRKPSALSYAISRSIKKLEKHIEKYDELIADATAKFQKQDKDGVFEYYEDNKTPKFTAANHASFRKAYNEIKNTEFEYDPFYASAIPADLELVWFDYFVPFVIKELPGDFPTV